MVVLEFFSMDGQSRVQMPGSYGGGATKPYELVRMGWPVYSDHMDWSWPTLKNGGRGNA